MRYRNFKTFTDEKTNSDQRLITYKGIVALDYLGQCHCYPLEQPVFKNKLHLAYWQTRAITIG